MVVFLPAVMFSHSGKLTGIVITTAHYLNHPDGWKTARNRNLLTWFSAKSFNPLTPTFAWAIEHPVPEWVKLSFVIFDIWAL